MNIDILAKQAGSVSEPTHDQLHTGHRQLQDAMGQADTGVVALRRRRSRRWAITALAGAAAVAATVLVLPLATAPSASAEQVLLVTAKAAGQQPDPATGAPYWYVRSEVDYPATKPYQREIWLGRTQESVMRDEGSGVTGDVVDPTKVRTDSDGVPARFPAGGGAAFSWQDLEALPTDPDALGALLRENVAGHPSGEDNELWETVTGMLRESPASPALRQALWEVAAQIPDVELVGPMTDAIGRHGTAIERDELDQGWFRIVYILDPETGTLLESHYLDEHGDVEWRMTQLVQEPSDTAPQAQPPLCGPGSVPEHSC
ncbi:CU044_5270 family protein [Kineococcus rubinsiae]|uniref:CU044_5270 family protein n=1 Tax=Kineococcus rubinsiae TaxID=2609562 RepID=UPI001430A392|nr:CU044_5270 family protein [Kineococcus rubinsiae]NIZ90313.1 hypothetical protein [Kineococcus rubinsiae]